ncbi:MAG: cellulose 1,4-beta-cellobiosidase [Oscillospiraceae bacterium]|nr:cellulose 1,4-beta-cellobiosidase [Oscillospiraceae bacterium]
MLMKKSKAVISGILTAAMAANALTAGVIGASAAGTRTKEEAFGDSTYAERFLSLYDDVVTHGQENGYLSKNDGGAGSFGIPYHAVEEVIIEAPDYGHETTSEAMSYLVWVAAMHDKLATETGKGSAGDLAKAWKTMEVMIPDVQDNFWTAGKVSAQYCGEYDTPEQCAEEWGSEPDKTAENPIYSLFTSVYQGKGKGGLYLMHWLADVENWYGYGQGTNFTFINTFQRGEQESCWETVPHPCVEELKFGNPQKGMKGVFNRDAQVTPQYAYTNAPDAEDRAIQGVFDAIKWGVGDASVSAKASEMGDELRNNMYDKYYQEISENTTWANGNAGDRSKHYLMNWYTSWGGALASSGQNWCWQIGCSHAHEFYQNPLAAYALITELKSGMKAEGAAKDYETSLTRQMEFYQWLQSSNGPIAGGATNSYKGRYEAYPSGSSTFYGMCYTPHPVYADPGSNHWIGNQVWAVQRLAELFYWERVDKNQSIVSPGGVSLDEALETILDKWVAWFVNNSVLTTDGECYMPSNLDWKGQPDTWANKQSANTGLTCEITGYGNGDTGCLSSLSNTLIYYAKAKGVKGADIAKYDETAVGGDYKSGIDGVSPVAGAKTYSVGDAEVPAVGLYLAQQIMDRTWANARDDIGLSRVDHNGSLARMFSQPVHVQSTYSGTMPNGDKVEPNATFLSLRSMYLSADNCKGVKTSDEALALVQKLQAAYDKDVAAGASWSGPLSASSAEGKAELEKFKNVGEVELKYHRFWHMGDVMMALGTLANLYGDELTPDSKEPATQEETPTSAQEETPTAEQGESGDPSKILWGDADVSGAVDIMDVIRVNKVLVGAAKLEGQGLLNADVNQSGDIDSPDSLNILKLALGILKQSDMPVKG